MMEIQEAWEEDKSIDYAMKVCGLDGTALPGTAQFTVANYIAGLRLRLATPKHEGRTISWQLINDIIDETLKEEAAPLECAIQVILAANGYTAINEPAAPEPRTEEPRP